MFHIDFVAVVVLLFAVDFVVVFYFVFVLYLVLKECFLQSLLAVTVLVVLMV